MTHPMTITEKILAAHAGLESVRPGELIKVDVDLALANDITAPLAIGVFKEIGRKKVFDSEKIALIPDHFVPNKDIKSAQNSKKVRDFALEMGIVNFFDVGNMGIEHALLPEQGLIAPGEACIGAASMTCPVQIQYICNLVDSSGNYTRNCRSGSYNSYPCSYD